MGINYKEWNVKDLGDFFIVGFILTVVIAIMHLFISPLLGLILPVVFTAPLTITDILLFLLLVVMLLRR